jgi:hypothetical protein
MGIVGTIFWAERSSIDYGILRSPVVGEQINVLECTISTFRKDRLRFGNAAYAHVGFSHIAKILTQDVTLILFSIQELITKGVIIADAMSFLAGLSSHAFMHDFASVLHAKKGDAVYVPTGCFLIPYSYQGDRNEARTSVAHILQVPFYNETYIKLPALKHATVEALFGFACAYLSTEVDKPYHDRNSLLAELKLEVLIK